MTTCLQVAQHMKADLNRNSRELADWLREQYGRPHVGYSGAIGYECSLRGVTLDYLDNDDGSGRKKAKAILNYIQKEFPRHAEAAQLREKHFGINHRG